MLTIINTSIITFVNMDYIVDRIKDLIERNGLSASDFADRIGVKRANVSHVMSGRNKPSLEFVLRICNAFSDVSPDDLLLEIPKTKVARDEENTDGHLKVDIPSDPIIKSSHSNDGIEKIVLFYKDKTFTEYKSR